MLAHFENGSSGNSLSEVLRKDERLCRVPSRGAPAES
jgi:hypothetical protein